MLTKLAENLYRQVVPLPNNPLREINAYLITGERNLLIDTGFNRPECEEALRSAFDQLGITETDLFITHLHSDHCGLIGKFAREGSVIYAGETDGELINFETGNLYWRMLDALFVKYGFPKADFGYNTDIHPGRKYCQDKRVDFTYVREGDVLHYGGYDLQAVLTPGHTPGHMCLYDAGKKLLFCGDHILGTITPNITIELSAENPLRDYLESRDFTQVGKVTSNRTNVLLRDQAFVETVAGLGRYITFSQILLPALCGAVGLLGFIVSWLMVNGRRMEFAVLRGLGASKGRVFATFFLEQGALALLGCVVGSVLLTLLGGGWVGWLAAAAFLVCYLMGCALAVAAVGRTNLMSLLSERE